MKDEWKAILAYVYAFICFFDFVIVPSWIGINRPPIDDLAYLNIEKFRQVWQHHRPFTLQGGGMFHLAFGALLTGSVINGVGRKKE
jgi:hypothetical protein